MSNTYNTDTREIDGRKYHIEWQYDDTYGRPEEESDGHGVCADISFDPETFGEDHDPEDGELDLEEVVRHKMMRVLHARWMPVRPLSRLYIHASKPPIATFFIAYCAY